MNKLGIILSVLLLGAGFLEARGSEQTIQVEYKPNAKVKISPSSVPSQKIFFDDFRDQRPQPRLVGENLEDRGNRVVVSSDPQAAGNLVKSALNKEFRNKGFSVVGSPGQAEKIIGGSLMKFWTVETNRYNTETLLKLEVRDKNGRVLFQKNYSGAGKNFGRSLSETNYSESASDSLVMIVEALFSDHEFLRALAEKPAVLRAEEKAPHVVPPVAPSPAPPAQITTEPPAPNADYLFHKVYAGETLATIAKWYSGNANNWKVLASHNLDKEPFKLKAQEVVRIPLALASANKAQPGFSTASPKASVHKGKKTPPPSPAAPGPPPPVTGPAFGPK